MRTTVLREKLRGAYLRARGCAGGGGRGAEPGEGALEQQKVGRVGRLLRLDLVVAEDAQERHVAEQRLQDRRTASVRRDNKTASWKENRVVGRVLSELVELSGRFRG